MAPGRKDRDALSLFADELKAHRAQRGWTQADVAAKAAYSESLIAQVETCRRAATEDLAKALDRAFETPGWSEETPGMTAWVPPVAWCPFRPGRRGIKLPVSLASRRVVLRVRRRWRPGAPGPARGPLSPAGPGPGWRPARGGCGPACRPSARWRRIAAGDQRGRAVRSTPRWPQAGWPGCASPPGGRISSSWSIRSPRSHAPSVVLVPSPGIRPAGSTARQRPAAGGRITASGCAASNCCLRTTGSTWAAPETGRGSRGRRPLTTRPRGPSRPALPLPALC